MYQRDDVECIEKESKYDMNNELIIISKVNSSE